MEISTISFQDYKISDLVSKIFYFEILKCIDIHTYTQTHIEIKHAYTDIHTCTRTQPYVYINKNIRKYLLNACMYSISLGIIYILSFTKFKPVTNKTPKILRSKEDSTWGDRLLISKLMSLCAYMYMQVRINLHTYCGCACHFTHNMCVILHCLCMCMPYEDAIICVSSVSEIQMENSWNILQICFTIVVFRRCK